MKTTHWLIAAVLAGPATFLTIPSFAADTGKSKYENNEKDEKAIPLKDLPAPARETAVHEAKGGKLVKVEEMTKSGETVYEAVIRKGKAEEGVVINAKGDVLERHSEKAEK